MDLENIIDFEIMEKIIQLTKYLTDILSTCKATY